MAKLRTNAKKNNGIVKLKIVVKKLQRSLSLGRKTASDFGNSASVPEDVKEGHFAVTAVDDGETKRFVVPLSYLTHPAFLRLLEEAAEEFGFDHDGALAVPCRWSELLAEQWKEEREISASVSWESCKTMVVFVDFLATLVSKMGVVNQLVEVAKEISRLPECPNTSKKLYCNLVRRVNLLSLLFEELKHIEAALGKEEFRALNSMKVALESAKELLQSVNEGSKIYQVLQREKIADKFQEVTELIGKASSEIPYDKLDISEEVKEQLYVKSDVDEIQSVEKLLQLLCLITFQIELMHAQIRRAKRSDSPDLELYMELTIAQKEKDPEPAILKRLSEKLQLRTINDLKKESLALHEMVINGYPGSCMEEMSVLLKKLKDTVLSGNLEADTSGSEKSSVKHIYPVIPDDFRCPSSLALMKDPVIVSTGQTYERSCIQKWLDAGHNTCPKTQQTLLHLNLTPNSALKSLIAQWCEGNGVELPKKQGSCRSRKSGSCVSNFDQAAIKASLQKLSNQNPEERRAAAGELRLLAKRNADNRLCIAEAGAIPLLVELLSSPDPMTQEHAVTTLFNLSINETSKGSIVNAGAIPGIVNVLKNSSMEARENAAATLFSLSLVDKNKMAIGVAGAIPALIDLLCHGSPRGKKDAATAIFNLLVCRANKVRAVKAGIVVPLMRLLMDAGSGMVDEALAILAILLTHQEGKTAIGKAGPIPVLVELIRTGSSHNRENAAAALWSLCTGEMQHPKTAKDLGAEEALKELSENGTNRAKRKAVNLLELLHRIVDVIADP
ncbi:hypothetical protein HHK36_011202 [Tetracentron sinense]|uniref:U-box domain-containing protein 12 n=1 Tax=Tetracentron sinense TaxID=13715 RepID=A0A835DH06_TETSI|nr:hypothetical protein HHK36_011202 [Tetracentron sinense]